MGWGWFEWDAKSKNILFLEEGPPCFDTSRFFGVTPRLEPDPSFLKADRLPPC